MDNSQIIETNNDEGNVIEPNNDITNTSKEQTEVITQTENNQTENLDKTTTDSISQKFETNNTENNSTNTNEIVDNAEKTLDETTTNIQPNETYSNETEEESNLTEEICNTNENTNNEEVTDDSKPGNDEINQSNTNELENNTDDDINLKDANETNPQDSNETNNLNETTSNLDEPVTDKLNEIEGTSVVNELPESNGDFSLNETAPVNEESNLKTNDDDKLDTANSEETNDVNTTNSEETNELNTANSEETNELNTTNCEETNELNTTNSEETNELDTANSEETNDGSDETLINENSQKEDDESEKDDEMSSITDNDNDIDKDPVFVQVNEDKDDSDKEEENAKNPIEIEGENNRDDPIETDDDSTNRNEIMENDDDSQRDNDEFDKDDEELERTTDDSPLANLENDEDSLGRDTEFVPVDGEKDDKEEDDKETPIEEDPIASVGFEPINETQEGADEELCIIPDTERVLSQAEKDAASSITPLRDLLEANVTNESTENTENTTNEIPPAPPAETYVISKSTAEDLQTCIQCVLQRKVKFEFLKNDTTQYICSDNCLTNFKTENPEKYVLNRECEIRVKDLTPHKEWSFERKCATCNKKVDNQEENLMWEIMDFCSVACLSKYQIKIGSNCSNCTGQVRPNSLGKYCVRFGNDIRQFCTSHCLEEYKKGLKVCSYCHQDISGETDGFLAPVGDKGQFKDFCSKLCMDKYDILTNKRPPKVTSDIKCSVCKTDNEINIEFELDKIFHYFCSDRCFIAFSFVNNITSGKCSMCRRNFSNEILRKNTMFYDNVQHSFCSNSCQNIYIIAHRKIVPCVWCKVKKYNFDMIRRYYKTESLINMCSLNCLSLFQLSIDAVNSKKTSCNYCLKNLQPMYHLTMSDATIRNFCSYGCVISFQNQFKKAPLEFTNDNINTTIYPVPTGVPKKNKKFNKRNEDNNKSSDLVTIPVISNVQSLASNNNSNNNFIPVNQCVNSRTTRNKSNLNNNLLNSGLVDVPVQVKHHIFIKPAPLPEQRNVSTMCRVRSHNKYTNTLKSNVDKQIQTDECKAENILIPVPVPIYVPVPVHMYSVPKPIPLPLPIPIPVPLFIPTTRNSAKGIMKEIKKIQVKIPTDPYEAELLMMAEMVAGDKKEDNTDSESDVDDTGAADDGGGFSPEPVDASNTFGDDMLQMALKMATELDEPAVDLEGALTANTITAPQGGETTNEETVDDPNPIHNIIERQTSTRGRKRSRGSGRQSTGPKKRRLSHNVDIPIIQPAPAPEPVEKPDAHLCLKYTFGVNAWKQWVTTKNAELEKTSKYPKLFKTEILQLTADELNYSLCLFVKEVRKPNGAEYAPDTIYYLCLGIQQYLFENSRIDNIFCDPYYEQFTDSLDEVARKFSVLYNDSHYIVTRVEEEHLWESKQLGAHSPHVLLSTLMFFNTKHFNLTSVQEHMQLSFSHIMKHWKRNPNQSGVSKLPGSRNVLLRFYPPQAAIQNNIRKKKVYEQLENEENPLRCPVKLYEFYLSKCPESVKSRNDVFYLQPERSCVPDSPVWYSTTALCQEALEKMLHRVKMVKEINVALLTS